jgi:adenylyl-sulfate kinase
MIAPRFGSNRREFAPSAPITPPPPPGPAINARGPELREQLLGHRGAVLWLTGLSGAGKSTLANAVERPLLEAGALAAVLDGDVIRRGLCQGLGFSDSDRKENIRRVTHAALLVAESGAIVITALISPFAIDREHAGEVCCARGVPFAEVFVNAPLTVCEARDPKHLYRRARAGELPAFTGISSPYEPPISPALELRTDTESVGTSVDRLTRLALALSRIPITFLEGSGAGV